MMGEFNLFPVRAPVENAGFIGLRFTTDGSGVPTLLDDYGGKVTVTQATNTYTCYIGECASIKAAPVGHSLTATVNAVVTTNAAAGTVIIAFSGSFFSATCDLMALVSDALGG